MSADDLRVARVDDGPTFASLESEWDALLERSSARSVFLRWGWLHASWIAFGTGHDLRLYTVRDGDGRLVGVAPLQRRRTEGAQRVRVQTFLGTERISSDFLDFVVDAARERDVADALWSAIAADAGEIDVALWSDVLATSVVARLVVPAAAAAGWHVWDDLAEYCPHLPLPDSVDTILAARGKSLRDNVRRSTRRLEPMGLAFDAVDTPEALPGALDALYRLHAARWSRKGRQGNFRDPRIRAFHDLAAPRLAKAGALRLYRLRLHEREIAVLYALEHRGVLSYYQAGFDPTPPDPSMRAYTYSPGVVLIAKVMGDAIARGDREFDFLRGHESAKFRWTPTYRVTRTLTAVPPRRPRARLLLEGVRGMRSARKLAKRLLGRRDPVPPPSVPGGGF